MGAPQKLYLRLTPPSLKDNTAFIDRLAKAVRRRLGSWPLAPLPRLGEYAALIRESDYHVTATLAQGAAGLLLASLEPGDTRAWPPHPGWQKAAELLPAGLWQPRGLGVALDVGSTHLQGELYDLASGARLAAATALNPQAEVGADILTRIHAAAAPGGLARLHRMLTGAAGRVIDDLCASASRRRREIVGLVAAGNTTMTHFLLGLEVASIPREPYLPLVNRPAPFYAGQIGLEVAPGAVAWVLPNVGSYFGGDLVAGIVAADLHHREDLAILVDVGTNAEVVLGNRDWLVACAGAAGPALEGGVAKMGILAQPGAIERVSVDPETLERRLKVIPGPDGKPPPAKGLCGSGLLTLLASLYLSGAMNMRGRLVLRDHPRIVETDEGRGYVVATAAQSQGGEPIVVNEVEIDILLRSKAAMYTILRTVLLEVGLEFGDLRQFFIAGAFGNVIDPQTAVTLGMLPDLPRERFVPLGNSSLAGCARLLNDPAARPAVEEIADRLTYLELNVNQALMNRFSAARFIPHTDAGRFPSVPARH